MHHRQRHTIAIILLAVISAAHPARAEDPKVEKPTRVSLGIRFGLSEVCPRPAQPLAPTGVCILGTRPGSAAERAGIKAGDVLQQLGTIGIERGDDLLEAVRSLKIADRPRAVVWRHDGPVSLALEITERDILPATAEQPAIPVRPAAQLPYRIHPLPADPKPLLAKVRDVGTAVWVFADVLNIVHRDKREGVMIQGTFQLPMNRVPGTDVWVLQLEMKGWNRSFFSYGFSAPGTDHAVFKLRYFQGPDAIVLPEILENVRGKVYERTLHSRFLDEARQVTVYVPPGAKRRGTRTLFMADGQSTEAFARAIEPLIVSGRVAPFAIVGVHAALSQLAVDEAADISRDRRSQEYLPGIAPEAYEKHMRFFSEEVLPWASREYGVSPARDDRAVFGFSSGAAFAAAAAVRYPDAFAHSLPFSVGVQELPARPSAALPRFHLIAGELEPDFVRQTQVMRDKLLALGAEATLDIYMSGHDQLMWQAGLARLIPRVFPASHP
jgi:enterochelin esterase-like enzyme